MTTLMERQDEETTAGDILADPVDGSLEELETDIIAGVDPVCEDCTERVGTQAHMLAAFVGIGRITVEMAIDRVNERVVCAHLGSSAMQGSIVA